MLKATSSNVNVSQITGVLPVVNGGTGVTTSTGTGNTVLSAAPTLSGNVTLSTGNLIVASGQGIDFSATPGTGTSELLDDYEEGTWTPIDISVASLTFTTASGTYTKIGNTVTLTMSVVYPSTASSDITNIGGLPFTAASTPGSGGAITYTDANLNMTLYQTGVGLRLYITAGTSVQNVSVSTKYVEAIIIYRV